MAIEQTARHCWALWYAVISASQLLATKDFLVCTPCMNSSEMVLWLLEGIPSEHRGRWGAAGEGDEGALFEVVTKPCISARAEMGFNSMQNIGEDGLWKAFKVGMNNLSNVMKEEKAFERIWSMVRLICYVDERWWHLSRWVESTFY